MQKWRFCHFIHLYVVPNLYGFHFVENKEDILKNVGNETILVTTDSYWRKKQQFE